MGFFPKSWIGRAPGLCFDLVDRRRTGWRFALIFTAAWMCAGCGNTWTGSIGAVLAKDNRSGRVFVREVPSDMGAGRGGVFVDDELVAVDGHPVRAMTVERLHAALAGKVGTKVKLQILRDGAMRELVVERGPLRGPAVD